MRTTASWTIFRKLVALIVIVTVVIVGGLAVYFPARHLEALRTDLQEKAASYGKSLSTQLRSAIAFDDRETAREVLAGLASDPEVIGTAVITATGVVLESTGDQGGGANLITVIEPIVSLEGPRGTLVIRVSTARIATARSQIIRSTAVAGSLAVGLGILAAWLIARSLAKRLKSIGAAASRVAAGDLADVTFHDFRADEIGTLAANFAMMVQQIRELMASRDEQARQEQFRLEALVASRTIELAGRNRELAFVLDNVDQGLFIVDLAGRISTHRSAAVERLLGPVPGDGLLSSYVLAFDHDQAAWFDVCWASLRDDLLPVELALSQIPRRFTVAGRELELDYQCVDDGGQRKILVVVSDITARIARERAERDQTELGGLVTRLLADRQGFLDFHADVEEKVAAIEASDFTNLVALRRDVHTLKGTAALFGVASIADPCHVLEDRLEEFDADAARAAVAPIVRRWRELAARLEPFTKARADLIEISDTELEQFLANLRRMPGGAALARIVENWRNEPVRARLERLAGHIRALSSSLGKGPVDVRIESDHTRLAAERFPHFWGSLVHVVRNAVDHGIEMPDERIAAGKPLEAPISLRAEMQATALVVEIEDGGRGIDWSSVAASAQAAGMPAQTTDDLVRALFADGLSTRAAASMTSGRGVGLAAAHQACVDAGGEVRVHSQPGVGTRFTFVLPGELQ